MTRSNRLSYVAVFLFGILAASSWHWLKANFYFRPVQYLRSSDRAHQAVLERVDGIDLNFRIRLDGKEIYRSPDFAPSRDISFRETLLWDDGGNILIFEVGGHRLFGYNVAQGQALSNAAVLQAKVSPVPISKYRFEGQWPSQSGS